MDIFIRKQVLQIQDYIIKIRRTIHQFPQLGFKQQKTAALIISQLKSFQAYQIIHVAITGIIALLKGTQQNPCFLIRADMDALPIAQNTGLSFSSKNQNSHCCGHDGHVAMALGAAKIAAKFKNKLKGTVKFCFQPGQEGYAGAKHMVQDSDYPVLENPSVNKCFAIHLGNFQYFGTAVICQGPFTAYSNRLKITIKGKSCHSMFPNEGIDANYVASQVIINLYTLKTLFVDPFSPVILNINTINGGDTFNIISNKCVLQGTYRMLNSKIKNIIQEKIKQCVYSICSIYGAQCQVQLINSNYRPVVNQKQSTLIINNILKQHNCNIISKTFALAGQDFCHFSQIKPSCYFVLGSAPLGTINEGKVKYNNKPQCPNHANNFIIDQQVLSLGTSIWINLIQQHLM